MQHTRPSKPQALNTVWDGSNYIIKIVSEEFGLYNPNCPDCRR